jgi:uncharacterized protein YfaS (alpha-2-macroglobulin family)
MDQSGAVLPGAEVTAVGETGREFSVRSDARGGFALAGLPTGLYRVLCSMVGFQSAVALQVPVFDLNSTALEMTLEVGSVTETVAVTSEAPLVETTTASLSSTSSESEAHAGTAQGSKARPLFTPRLRNYFPETLIWRPEVITDRRGRAKIDFPMADSITSWRMSVVASTRNGDMGLAETELRSFQPFFLEHDPPATLTIGDRIHLPVLLRNYEDQPQTLLAEMHPESWFKLSSSQQQVQVEAGSDVTATFSFDAVAPVREGKQRVTARNESTGDAVEQPVHVHPHGQEIWFTSSRILTASQNALDVTVPTEALPGSIDGELRIYPNLLAHVLDAINGIGRRPTGCAEQITSTAYLSLMALELLQRTRGELPSGDSPQAALTQRALRAVRLGVDMLADRQTASGGIAYWDGTRPDLALSAYVYRFLIGASRFVEIERISMDRLHDYLLSEQNVEGAWSWRWWGDPADFRPSDAGMTAYLARTLATTMHTRLNDDERARTMRAVVRALEFIEEYMDDTPNAYVIGNYALAAVAVGHRERLPQALAQLQRIEHREANALYWSVERNTTVFYGWGWAGRFEATALAVQALALMRSAGIAGVDEKIDQGLQFLLRRKDRYSTWYSTQATQNVLEALLTALPGDDSSLPGSATVLVNGQAVGTVSLPPAAEATGPVVFPLRGMLKSGDNRVEVNDAGDRPMNTSLLTSYYVPWGQTALPESIERGDSRALRLRVRYDRTDASPGDTIRSTVDAERVGFRGYGMMLAEVGLPPGAEVDRATLQQAAGSVDGLRSYEVRPDRVVFYLWPRAGGVTFSFGFRLRYALEAMSAPSQLYDYYNPESAAVVAPVQFRAQPR